MGSVSPAPSPTQHHPNTLAEDGVPTLPELWQLRAMPTALGSCSPPFSGAEPFPDPSLTHLHAIPSGSVAVTREQRSTSLQGSCRLPQEEAEGLSLP